MNDRSVQQQAGSRRRQSGFTLVEAMIVVGIIGIVSAVALPNASRYLEASRGRAAAKSVADAFNIARAQAIRTGNNQIVFFSASVPGAAPATDPNGTALTSADGREVLILILDDGAPGSVNQNCEIDVGEARITFQLQDDVDWGPNLVPLATEAPDDDAVNAIPANGSSFFEPDGATPATWVQFRPDGVPIAISSTCVQGRLGSGGGTIYKSTQSRDYAITLSPLGGVRVHVWNAANGGWTI